MPVITDITQQKKRTEFYNIFVDGVFFCALSDLQLSLSGIRVGQEVESSRLDEFKKSSEFSKLYNRALYYLSFRPRSTAETRRYLQQKIDDAEQLQIESVIDKLTDSGLLNDTAFTRNWVENRNLLKPRSKRQLEMELRKKGIEREVIESVLAEQAGDTEHDNIRRLIAKKQNTPRGRDQQKLIQYLSSKGFAYSDIREVMSETSSDSKPSEK